MRHFVQGVCPPQKEYGKKMFFSAKLAQNKGCTNKQVKEY
jgi:hypothetical protein